jgi:hypothetical protein
MPRSTAFRIRAIISFLSAAEPKLIPMRPSPMAETSRSLFPSLRFCIVPLKMKLLGHFIHKNILASWYCSSLTFSIQSTVLPLNGDMGHRCSRRGITNAADYLRMSVQDTSYKVRDIVISFNISKFKPFGE